MKKFVIYLFTIFSISTGIVAREGIGSRRQGGMHGGAAPIGVAAAARQDTTEAAAVQVSPQHDVQIQASSVQVPPATPTPTAAPMNQAPAQPLRVQQPAPVQIPAPEPVIPTPSLAPIIPSGPETSSNDMAALQTRMQNLENALNTFKSEVNANVSALNQSLQTLNAAAQTGASQSGQAELEKLKVQLVKIEKEIGAMKQNFAAFSGIKNR